MCASDGFAASAAVARAAVAPRNVVMHIVGCSSIQHGSCEDYLLSIASSCTDHGLIPVFVYPERPVSSEYVKALASAGGRVMVIPGTDSPSVAGARGLWSAMTSIQPAVVHAHFGRAGYLAVLLARIHGRPQVYLTKHQMSDDAASVRHRISYRALGSAANTIFCVSEPIRQQLIRLGVRADKLRVSLIGVDVGRFRPDPVQRAETRRSLGLTEEQIVILCVSHLRPRKGLEFLVDAMTEVSRRIPETRLLICGDGEMREALEARISSLDLEGPVSLLGMRHDVPALLAAADLFACPSLSEGACSSVLEAMAAGLPVLTTPVGYADDLIEDGVNGMVVRLGDSGPIAAGLSALAGDRSSWSDMGRHARRTVAERVGVATEARRITDYYEACLTGSVGEPS